MSVIQNLQRQKKALVINFSVITSDSEYFVDFGHQFEQHLVLSLWFLYYEAVFNSVLESEILLNCSPSQLV